MPLYSHIDIHTTVTAKSTLEVQRQPFTYNTAAQISKWARWSTKKEKKKDRLGEH